MVLYAPYLGGTGTEAMMELMFAKPSLAEYEPSTSKAE